MRRVWDKDYDGYLDYVTGWHAQAMKLLKKRKGQFAYVTTNSITQGQPVPALFGSLFREGWRIKFAHRTFSWDSEAPGKAAVHCVNVGFSRGEFKPLADIPKVTYGSKAVDNGNLIRPGASWALHSTVLCLIGRPQAV